MAARARQADYVLNQDGQSPDLYAGSEDQPNAGPVQGQDPYAMDLGGIEAPPDTGELGPPTDRGGGNGWYGDEGLPPVDPGKVPVPTGGHVPPIVPPADPSSTPTMPQTPTSGLPANGDLGPSIAARLKDIFGQSLTPGADDPQVAAARLQNQRTFENQRALAAERMGVEGTGDSGGFDTTLLGLGQDRGAADLSAVAGVGKDRVQQILQALQLASGNQNSNNQLGLSYAQLMALLNSQALSAELNGAGA